MDSRFKFISAMGIFGTLGLFVRYIPVPSGELALYRAILAVLMIGTVLLVTGQKIPLRKLGKELPLLFLSGCALGLNWVLLFEAYKYTSISTATLSYYFAPVIVTAVCPVLFREKLGARQWICFAMSTLGIILITGPGGFSTDSRHMTGVLLGLGAACFYAAVVLLNKSIRQVNGLHRTFLQFLAAIIVLTVYVCISDGIHPGALDLPGWICLLIVGLVHTGTAYCLYFSSLKSLPGQKAAILSYVDPLVAILVSVLLLGESMTVFQVIGGSLILGFTLWNELSDK